MTEPENVMARIESADQLLRRHGIEGIQLLVELPPYDFQRVSDYLFFLFGPLNLFNSPKQPTEIRYKGHLIRRRAAS